MTSELRQAAENLRLQIRGRVAELEAQRGQLQAQMTALGDGPARPALSSLARQIIQEMSGDTANGAAMPVNGNDWNPAAGSVIDGVAQGETGATTTPGSEAQTILSPARDRDSSEQDLSGAATGQNKQSVAGDTAVVTASKEEVGKDGGPVAMAPEAAKQKPPGDTASVAPANKGTGEDDWLARMGAAPVANQEQPVETAASVLDEQEADEDDWLARIAAAQADRQEQADAAAVDGPDEQGAGEDDWLATMDGEPAAATEADDWLAAFG